MSSARACLEGSAREDRAWKEKAWAEQWLVVVTCRDEKHQAELCQRFQEEGLECRALLSESCGEGVDR